MKTTIVFKWTKNPQDARVSSNGAVDWGVAKISPSDDDAAAIAVARALAEGDEIVGVTGGEGDNAWAAARGAARTVAVTDAQVAADAGQMASALAGAIKRAGDADLVVIGDCAWDAAVPALVAAQLGLPAVGGVLEAAPSDAGVRVVRRVAAGLEEIDVPLPAVLAVVARRAEEKAPGMRDVLAARKKPVDKVSGADVGARAGRVDVQGTALPEQTAARVFDGSDPKAAVDQLVAALRQEGVL